MTDLFVNLAIKRPFYYFSWVIIVAFSICVHEFAHAYTALRLGDDTAASRGHLSLNPVVQMGPVSLVMLFLIGIAWGMVPVNPSRLRHRAGDAIVSLSGPAANLILCTAFALACATAGHLAGYGIAARFFWFGARANAVLFILNMMPVPILDGWSVYKHVVPAMRRLDPRRAQGISMFVLIVIFVSPVGDLMWRAGDQVAHSLTAAWGVLFRLF